MTSLQLLPTRPAAKLLSIAITTDALEKIDIYKGSIVRVKKAKHFDIDQLTAWQTPDGIRITYAFKDGASIVLYSPKDEKLMDVYNNADAKFLGIVKNVEPPLPHTITAPDGKILVQALSDSNAHVGIRKGDFVVLSSEPVKEGDFVGIFRKTKGYWNFGAYFTAPKTAFLAYRDKLRFGLESKEVSRIFKLVGFTAQAPAKSGDYTITPLHYSPIQHTCDIGTEKAAFLYKPSPSFEYSFINSDSYENLGVKGGSLIITENTESTGSDLVSFILDEKHYIGLIESKDSSHTTLRFGKDLKNAYCNDDLKITSKITGVSTGEKTENGSLIIKPYFAPIEFQK